MKFDPIRFTVPLALKRSGHSCCRSDEEIYWNGVDNGNVLHHSNTIQSRLKTESDVFLDDLCLRVHSIIASTIPGVEARTTLEARTSSKIEVAGRKQYEGVIRGNHFIFLRVPPNPFFWYCMVCVHQRHKASVVS